MSTTVVAFLLTFTVPSLCFIAAVAVAEWSWRRRVRRLPKCEIVNLTTYRNGAGGAGTPRRPTHGGSP